MYHSTIPVQRIGIQGLFTGRLSIIAIGLFLLLSAGIAFATAVLPTGSQRFSDVPPVVEEAENELKDTLDNRLHLHLKRLSMRS
jgi:hypothetical protein